jgi:hypothetical protein
MRLHLLVYAPSVVMLVAGLVACGSAGVAGSADPTSPAFQRAVAVCNGRSS